MAWFGLLVFIIFYSYIKTTKLIGGGKSGSYKDLTGENSTLGRHLKTLALEVAIRVGTKVSGVRHVIRSYFSIYTMTYLYIS
jgi:hypothetical protein